jgi:hypothetical protein
MPVKRWCSQILSKTIVKAGYLAVYYCLHQRHSKAKCCFWIWLIHHLPSTKASSHWELRATWQIPESQGFTESATDEELSANGHPSSPFPRTNTRNYWCPEKIGINIFVAVQIFSAPVYEELISSHRLSVCRLRLCLMIKAQMAGKYYMTV